jgi:hypothetical protein
MGVVYFDEEQERAKHAPSRKAGFLDISGWLVRKGLAANQTSADLTLVVIAALAIGLTLFIAHRGFGANQVAGEQVSGQQIGQMNSGTQDQ